MKNFIETLKQNLLPQNFLLQAQTVKLESINAFNSILETDSSFSEFIEKEWSIKCSGSFIDIFQSGFLGSYALALWFMEFDEDNWFSFKKIHTETNKFLNSYSSVSERTELRLIKGSFKPMNLDLPVIVNYKDLTVTVLTGQLID